MAGSNFKHYVLKRSKPSRGTFSPQMLPFLSKTQRRCRGCNMKQLLKVITFAYTFSGLMSSVRYRIARDGFDEMK